MRYIIRTDSLNWGEPAKNTTESMPEAMAIATSFLLSLQPGMKLTIEAEEAEAEEEDAED